MTERGFLAYASNIEKADHYGLFSSAEEAEIAAKNLGWEWVLVIRREVADSGEIISETKRFYQPGSVQHTTVKPLSESETDFFAVYERQMSTPVTKLDELDITFGRLKRQARKIANGKSKTSL